MARLLGLIQSMEEEREYLEYNKEGMRLANDDCIHFLKGIKRNTVDLCLIDPPYFISKDTNFLHYQTDEKLKKRFCSLDFNFGEWDKEKGFDFPLMIKECYRVLKRSGTLICFYDIFKLQELSDMMKVAGFSKIRFGEWIKTNPIPLNQKAGYLSNCREVFLTGVKGGSATFNSTYDNGLYEVPLCQDNGRFHPTQKPVELIKRLIKKHSKEGDIVLDCFSGSGTTGVASYLTGRRFTGCELDRKYYTASVERIRELMI